MNEVLIKRFVKLIAQHTGLLIRPQDWNALNKKLLLRLKALKLPSLESYYRLLQASSDCQQLQNSFYGNNIDNKSEHQKKDGQLEWKKLLQLLTTGESYFFRDSGQIFLLKNIILPNLIAHQRQICQQQYQERPTLRIWSAGCSTGEEPYSLAILLTELIPDWQNWRLFVLGTDINSESIKKARAGIYGNWSFRTLDRVKKHNYFDLKNNEWSVQDYIRKLVRFESGNLVQDKFPDPSREMFNMDLILCRNVFVYFESSAIAQVLRKFYQTLRPGGYLLTAHAELYGQDLGAFSAQVFPQSVIYQRPQPEVTAKPNFLSTVDGSEKRSPHFDSFSSSSKFGSFNLAHPDRDRTNDSAIRQNWPSQNYSVTHNEFWLNPVPPMLDRFQSTSQTEAENLASDLSLEVKLQEIKELFERHKYQEVIHQAQQLIQSEIKNGELYYTVAKSFANLGKYREAETYCHKAIQFNYGWVEPYYLLAGIAEEKGEVDIAKSIFKKIIYLAPSSIDAYLHIAEIYETEGNFIRAKKMRFNAISLLEKMPQNTLLSREGDRIKVADLLCYIKKLI